MNKNSKQRYMRPQSQHIATMSMAALMDASRQIEASGDQARPDSPILSRRYDWTDGEE